MWTAAAVVDPSFDGVVSVNVSCMAATNGAVSAGALMVCNNYLVMGREPVEMKLEFLSFETNILPGAWFSFWVDSRSTETRKYSLSSNMGITDGLFLSLLDGGDVRVWFGCNCALVKTKFLAVMKGFDWQKLMSRSRSLDPIPVRL